MENQVVSGIAYAKDEAKVTIRRVADKPGVAARIFGPLADASINVDMIGRGRAEDLPGGGDDFVGVIGSFFDSKDLGETVKAVNDKQGKPLGLDYKFDEPISWGGYNNLYGRSDHINYARAGVPIAFFFTGLHGDYHQRTDEAEFIDYPHYARITNLLKDLTVEVGNGPRPRLNGTKPMKQKPIP